MDFKELFCDLEVDDHAQTAQSQTVEYLYSRGFNCKIEVPIYNRGDDTNGRIDIVAQKGGYTIGIEFDRKSPRKKSIAKLQNFECDYRLVLLRGGSMNYTSDRIEVLSIKLRSKRKHRDGSSASS